MGGSSWIVVADGGQEQNRAYAQGRYEEEYRGPHDEAAHERGGHYAHVWHELKMVGRYFAEVAHPVVSG